MCQVLGLRSQVSCVRFHVSGLMCKVSCVRSHMFFVVVCFFYKIGEFVDGGSVINYQDIYICFTFIKFSLKVFLNDCGTCSGCREPRPFFI